MNSEKKFSRIIYCGIMIIIINAIVGIIWCYIRKKFTDISCDTKILGLDIITWTFIDSIMHIIPGAIAIFCLLFMIIASEEYAEGVPLFITVMIFPIIKYTLKINIIWILIGIIFVMASTFGKYICISTPVWYLAIYYIIYDIITLFCEYIITSPQKMELL